MDAVDKIKAELNKIGLVLHPNKTNVFHYKQGVKFIGSVVKESRLYIGNRTKGNAWNVVNSISNEIIGKGVKNVTKEDIKDYQTRINSYLGFMSHGNTYKIRARLVCSKEFAPIL